MSNGARILPDYRDLARELEPARAGRSVALANGCFDLLHVGHVRLLRAAAREAEILVVALNSDASVRATKGAERPVVPLEERMEVVSALAGVDWVTSFDEPTADELLRTLRPDVHVKGTDWKEDPTILWFMRPGCPVERSSIRLPLENRPQSVSPQA